MNKKLDYLLHGVAYFITTKIFGCDKPFVGGLVINDRCNLKCRQCKVGDVSGKDLPYSDVCEGLNRFYEMGIRTLFIEGGEPFLWKDNGYQLDDIIDYARKIGFKMVSIYTNGTFAVATSADVVFVSIDGMRDTNNYLRGNVFDKVFENIKDSAHPNININFTINSVNQNDIEPFCEYTQQIKNTKGVFFNFHTPYYGVDELFIDISQKKILIERILRLKKRGFRILNSTACLKMVYDDDWERSSKLCYVFDKNKMFQCCRAIGNDQACKNCGYLGYPEIISTFKLRPSSIIWALNYLPLGGR
jgi:MoaA/NifB/PqqE/SkfB family radical SAM enzyme